MRREHRALHSAAHDRPRTRGRGADTARAGAERSAGVGLKARNMSGTTAEQPRALGLLMCTALLVGNTIGVGIFMLPAALAPYGVNAVPGWLITTVGCIFIAWVFAGLARAFP